MGLDITYVRQAKLLDAIADENHEPIDPTTREPIECDEYERPYVNPDFPGRADDVVDRAFYSAAESCGFNAGGYGGYGHWRNTLAKLAGYEGVVDADRFSPGTINHCRACWDGAQGPFSELINFSDCEGTIGAAVSAKLARDFAEFQAKADAHPDERFRTKYAEWRAAFECASDSGFVRFH